MGLQQPDLVWRNRIADGWSRLLQRQDGTAVNSDDVLVCGSDREALEVALGRLVASGDVVLVAEPVSPVALLAVLAANGRYVDTGRRSDGATDPLAVERACALHPEAVAYVEAPSLMANDDLAAWAVAKPRALVVDLRYAAWPRQLPDADAVVLALRDPDAPAAPVLHAVVVAAGWGRPVQAWVGEPSLGTAQLEHADAVLQGLWDRPRWAAAASDELGQLAGAFGAAASAWPGARPLGHLGLRASVECLGGDGEALARSLPAWSFSLSAHGLHPGRGVVAVDLTVQAAVQGLGGL